MGIVNITPDSFYYHTPTCEEAVAAALRLQQEGADIIDIGGESSRPGADPVTHETELARVLPVIKNLKGKLTIPISIDTCKPSIARLAVQAGASFINDITGFTQNEMVEVALEYNTDICVMHMLAPPKTMQINPNYPNGITQFLLEWFEKRIYTLVKKGINPKKIILDPGIGFGKTIADNLEIIHNLPRFKRLGFRVLLGVSRKSFLSKILNMPSSELLAPTIAMNVMAMAAHVDIIRVHDVKEHRAVIDLMQTYEQLNNAKRL